MAARLMLDPAAYVSVLQGRPWSVEAHCWDLVREVQRDLFARELPLIELDDGFTALRVAKLFRDHPERKRWRQVDAPTHGAIVLMTKPEAVQDIHAGVFLMLDGGGVMHADEDAGVTFDDWLSIQMRNWRCAFYVPR